MDDNFAAAAHVAMIVGSETLVTLYKKGILSAREVFEVYDRSLLNLEHHQPLFGDHDAVAKIGRQMIEMMIAEIRNAPDFGE